jgi:CDGSH-type Zn-finger protein
MNKIYKVLLYMANDTATQSSNDTRKKCGCGKTKDAHGYCDGSHAKK